MYLLFSVIKAPSTGIIAMAEEATSGRTALSSWESFIWTVKRDMASTFSLMEPFLR